jgi:serine O-acetyltransferase
MKFKDLKYLWYTDLYRYGVKNFNKTTVLKFLIINPGFKYTFFMRLCNYLKKSESKRPIKKILLPIFAFMLRHYQYKYGIEIPYNTKIGSGFYIGHFGCIIVNAESIIGKNCNISPGVTIGEKNGGCPKIGNGVYMASGAKIVGEITVGNNVAIGLNTVIMNNIPDNAIVLGNPAEIVSNKGINVMNTIYSAATGEDFFSRDISAIGELK